MTTYHVVNIDDNARNAPPAVYKRYGYKKSQY
jgi:hypothetical protein